MLFVRILAPALKPALAGSAILAAAAGGWFTIDRLRGDALTPYEAAIRAEGPRLLVAEFGEDADTVYAVDPDAGGRGEVARIGHAPGWGAFASVSPDGGAIAYTALAEDEPDPHAGSPAIAGVIHADGSTQVLAGDVDLLVPPVWRPDGGAIVVRRNVPLAASAGAFTLLQLGLDGSSATLAERTGIALFPIAFSLDGLTFYYASLDATGSDLWAVDAGGANERLLAHLSDEIARDWTLSPDGATIAYSVAESGTHPRIVTMTVDVATGAMAEAAAGPRQRIEFNPAWDAAGDLTIAAVDAAGAGGAAVRLDDAGEAEAVSATPGGLDLPLAWSPDGGVLAVRAVHAPSGEEAPGFLELVTEDGGRRRVSSSADALIVGWVE